MSVRRPDHAGHYLPGTGAYPVAVSGDGDVFFNKP